VTAQNTRAVLLAKYRLPGAENPGKTGCRSQGRKKGASEMTIETIRGYKLRFSNGYQVTKPRPYDDADYYWAAGEDYGHWEIIINGKVHEEFLGEFADLVERLEELNAAIQPRMLHH